jgi:hypothetical protein
VKKSEPAWKRFLAHLMVSNAQLLALHKNTCFTIEDSYRISD